MIIAYYQLMFILSLVCAFVYIGIWRRNQESNYLIAFVMIPVALMGYIMYAESGSVAESVMATKIIYIGGCFLPLLTLLGAISLCNIEIGNRVRMFLFGTAFAIYGMVLTIGKNNLFYKNMSFVNEDGVAMLLREYGPLHKIFYIVLVIYPLINFAILLYSLREKPEVSLKNLYLLFIVAVIGVGFFFAGRAITKKVELMPLSYVIIEVLLLMVSSRINLYNISASISESMLEHGADGLISFDRKRNFLVCNETARQMIPELEKARADVKLDSGVALFGQFDEWIRVFDVDEEAVVHEFERDDRKYEARLHALTNRDKVRGYYITIVDVTKERQYIEYMQKAAEAAIAADKAKSRFLAQMSHEIRTPINAVLGMNEMILRESTDNDVLEYADNIQSAGRNLLSIINSILDFSKIEDGKMEILPVQYDTASLINNLVNSIQERAKTKGLVFAVEVDERIPSALYGDDLRVTQVIMNLLSNAVKYTEKGSVTLSIRSVRSARSGAQGQGGAQGQSSARGQDSARGQSSAQRQDGTVVPQANVEKVLDTVVLEVAVRDTGIGIREEDMDRMFESFERVDEKRNRDIEGTGLGMSIVTGLLSMMGSRLNMESVYGEGSCFSFALEQGIANAEPIGDYTERLNKSRRKADGGAYLYAPGAKVLVVDDNDMNLKVAQHLMKRNGISPELAASGAEAIALMREKKYDLVFLDHMMPKMDGIETLEKLRQEQLILEETTVIALTANAVTGARETYMEAGFDDYLSKPIESAQLEGQLEKYLPREMISYRTKEEDRQEEPQEDWQKDPQEGLQEGLQEHPQGSHLNAEKSDPAARRSGLDEAFREKLQQCGISVEEGLLYCAGKESFYLKMLAQYASAYEEKARDLQDYRESGDLNAYRVAVHALKSTSKTIGAKKLSAQAKALEEAARDGDEGFIETQHPVLMEEYSRLADCLKNLEKLI